MALTHKQSQLIKTTVPILRERGEEISATVYRTLLVKHPELNNVLNLMHLKNGTLARALTVIILRFASNINHTSELIPRLERISNKHVTVGVGPQHYELLGKVLISVLGEAMGPAWTRELEEAWLKAYTMLTRMLQGREQHLYKTMRAHGWDGYRQLVIERKVAETQDRTTYSFYLVVPSRYASDALPLPLFQPGQFVTIRVFVAELGYYQTRQYHLSNAPGKDYYRITVKREPGRPVCNAADGAKPYYAHPGVVSNLLIDSLHPGDDLYTSHPSGDYFLDVSEPSNAPLVLISAGIGISPLISMLDTIAETQSRQRPVTFVHCCRHEALFARHVRDLQTRWLNLKSCVFKTRLGRDEWLGGLERDFEGRLDLDKLPRNEMLHVNNTSTEYFVCGPEAFMQSVAKKLMEMGVRKDQIRTHLFTVGQMAFENET